MQSTPAAGWETVLDINLNGVWRTFKAAEPHVAAQRGQLVAIASMASFVHSPLHGSYAASKAGVWALCDSLRVELREVGVNVACIHPTFFKTPMISDALDDPVTRAVWNDFTGPFTPAPIDQVVRGIISGIESRRAQVVIPKTFLPNALAPGILRPLVDRFGFRRANIRSAIAHVDNP